MKKSKMSFVTQNLAPFRVDWINELSKYYEISVYYFNDIEANVNPKYINRKPYNCSVIKLEKKSFYMKRICERNPDFIILDGYGFKEQILNLIFLKIKKIPIFLNVDGGIIRRESIFKKNIKRYLLSRADYYFSTSELTDLFLKNYGVHLNKIIRHKFTTLFDTDICEIERNLQNRDSIRRELKINKFSILFVGKFIITKGITELICALEDIPNIQLIMIGGEETQLNEVGINIKNKEHVEFIDFLDKKKILQYMCACDLFILPTYSDVWGLSVIEALSCGMPVITTDKCIAGLTFIRNKENGFIIPAQNVEILHDTVLYCIENKELLSDFRNINLNEMKMYTIDKSTYIDFINIENKIHS